MSSPVKIECEDLETVQLVRMEDVQPDRTVEYVDLQGQEVFETCIVDGEYMIDNDNKLDIGDVELTQNDDDDVIDSGTVDIEAKEGFSDLIIPDSVNEDFEVASDVKPEHEEMTIPQYKENDSWPTLEILPGGVINPKIERTEVKKEDKALNEMMYACAKCSQSFKYLFCLVKHVKTHEEQNRCGRKMTTLSKKIIELKKKNQEDILEHHKRRMIKFEPKEKSEKPPLKVRRGKRKIVKVKISASVKLPTENQ